jgi:hypothetical protein
MWFTLPLDVIWKHQMGERHWTFLRLIAHTFFFKIPLFIIGGIMTYRNPPETDLPSTFTGNIPFISIEGFILIMWIFGVANLVEIHNRRKRGIEWYSHYWGTPRFLPDKPIVHWLVIPLGSALIATGCWWLCPAMGVYFYILAGLQMLDATDTYRARRVEKLDRRDREIDMEIKTAELEYGYRGPLEIVRIATPAQRMRTPEQESRFEARWQKVLKSSDAQKT